MLSPACAFLGAALLFGLQPIVARQVIPVLGGSPSVWTACVLFFSTVLLLDYADRNASSVPWDARANETLATVLLWVALSAIPSSLMLGVTAYLSTDIAAVPLLWVVPCALYLLTLIASFSRFWPRVTALSGLLLPIAVPAALAVQSAHAPTPAPLFAALQFAAFVVAALACHGALAVRRPSPDRLTVFYLWIAIGGVLGGAVNTLVAPALFSSVLEYPLMLIAALVLPTWCAAQRPWQAWGRFAAFIGVASVPSALLLRAMDVSRALVLFVAVGIPLAFCFASRHRGVQAGVIVALIVTPFLAGNRQEKVLYTARSFFGVHKVVAVDDGAAHILQHGTTVHGRQSLANELRREPAGYYQHGGPFGDIDRLSVVGGGRRVGVADLGTGTLAAYALPGDEWTFFEIDPTVERIARNAAFFTYLGDCGGRCRVILGARISIRAVPARSFDLLVFDVFSSDAIPVHLLTQEAIAEYTEKLRPGGLIAFHISNRYLHLPPVLAAGAAANQWSAVVRNHTADQDDRRRGGLSSDWVVAAKSEATLAPFVTLGWRPLGDTEPRVAAWTDDYSNVLAVATWRRSNQ
jgi:SAM-dependent methyltransferase